MRVARVLSIIEALRILAADSSGESSGSYEQTYLDVQNLDNIDLRGERLYHGISTQHDCQFVIQAFTADPCCCYLRVRN